MSVGFVFWYAQFFMRLSKERVKWIMITKSCGPVIVLLSVFLRKHCPDSVALDAQIPVMLRLVVDQMFVVPCPNVFWNVSTIWLRSTYK